MQGGCSLGASRNAMERSYSIPARNEKEDHNLLSPALPTREGKSSCCHYITLLTTFLFHILDRDYIQSSYCISGPFDGNPEPVIIYYQQRYSRKPLYCTVILAQDTMSSCDG